MVVGITETGKKLGNEQVFYFRLRPTRTWQCTVHFLVTASICSRCSVRIIGLTLV